MAGYGGKADIEGSISGYGADWRESTAISIGQRNTCTKSLCWGFKIQCFSWSFVKLTSLSNKADVFRNIVLINYRNAMLPSIVDLI